jgi:hypothetical protein
MGIIDKLIQWAKDTHPGNLRIFWLHGMAGEGKSTIATSVASRLNNEEALGASFFFSRGDPNNCRKLFTTIVLSFANHHPQIEDAIFCKMNRYRWGTDVNPFSHLILEPILDMKESFDLSKPSVLFLDALDESGTEDEHVDLLDFIFDFLTLPLLFRLFISSRPEKDIKQKLNDMGSLVYQHDLKNDKAEISVFVDWQLKVIKRNWPSVNIPIWPGYEKCQALVNRACGLFIWAATAMRFIDEEDPVDNLISSWTAPPMITYYILRLH